MPRKSKSKGLGAAPAGARPAAPARRELLLDGDADGDAGGGALRVNQRFAHGYEAKKQAQELARAQELGLLDPRAQEPDSEDDISEDEGEQLTARLDRKVLATIAAIRRRDPAVYDPTRTFFEPAPPAADGADDGAGGDDQQGEVGAAAAAAAPAAGDGGAGVGARKPAKRRVTAKDVLRQQLLEAAASGQTDAFAHDAEDDVGGPRARLEDGDRNPKVYDDEQAALRRAFLESAGAADDDDVGGSGEAAGLPLLAVKQRPAKRQGGRAAAAAAAAAGAQDDSDGDGSGGDDGLGVATVDRDTLREFLRAKSVAAKAPPASRTTSSAAVPRGLAQHADELADPDAFLEAYMRSRAWEEEEDDDDDDDGDGGGDGAGDAAAAPEAGAAKPPAKSVSWFGGGAAADEDELDADVADVERADAFEAAYNFRFEEPEGGVIATHARAVEGSLRRKDPKRKEERERRKERKEEERAAAEAETRRLMNLKRQGLKGRMVRIRDTAGAGVDMETLARVLGDDLDADWDPAAYDARMAALFGDEYYAQGEAEQGGAAAAAGKAAAGAKARAGAAAPATDAAAAGPDAAAAAAADDDDDGDDAGVAPWVFGDGPRPAWAGPSAEELAAGADDGLGGVQRDGGGGGGGDDEEAQAGEEGGEEEEEDPAVTGRQRGKRGRKAARGKPSEVARVKALLAREAAAGGGAAAAHGGPAEDTDEVLALGFEDVIAGGLRTRFAYTPVDAGDFGLSAEEILLADDGTLNAFLGLRRLAPYRETPWVMPPKVRKRAVGALRARLRAELLARAPELVAADAPAAAADSDGATAAVGNGAHAGEATAVAAVQPVEDANEADAGGGGVDAPAASEGGRDGAAAKKRRRRKHTRAAPTVGDAAGEAAPPSEPVYVTNSFRPVAAPAAAAAGAAAAAPVAQQQPPAQKKKKRQQQQQAEDDDAAALVKLPSGGQIKKARLATYAGL